MSRGPGRLQRRILEVLAEVPEGGHLSTTSIAQELDEEWGKEWGDGEFWEEWRRVREFRRQVRRALDSLHAAGRVGKELQDNPDVFPAKIACWHLPGTRPHNAYRTVTPLRERIQSADHSADGTGGNLGAPADSLRTAT